MMHHHTKVGYIKFSSLECMTRIKTSLKFETFAVTLTLYPAISSFHKTLQRVVMCHQLKKVVKFGRCNKKQSISDYITIYGLEVSEACRFT